MWLEIKYISLLSANLRNFKRKSQYLWNFSCPICGDSQDNRKKARGYAYPKGNTLLFKCHNCQVSLPFSRLLEQVNPILYKDFIVESFKENSKYSRRRIEEKSTLRQDDKGFSLRPDVKNFCERVLDNSFAYDYLVSRKIGRANIERLYYTDDLNKLSVVFPKYKEHKFHKEPRIVIPIYDRRNELVGITARAIYKSELRYIVMRIDDEVPLIFGMDRVDLSRRIYVTEGAFDSMFLENSIAVDGADFQKLDQLVSKDQTVIIFDNQPRNRVLIKQIDGIADKGWSMFVWPSSIKEKDINEYVMKHGNGIQEIIDENIFSGLTLKMKLAEWKKV